MPGPRLRVEPRLSAASSSCSSRPGKSRPPSASANGRCASGWCAAARRSSSWATGRAGPMAVGQTPAELRELIERLRRQRWTGAEIAHALALSPAMVARYLRRQGLARLSALEPPVPIVRYEYRQPGALVHLDIKKLGRIGRVGHRIHGDRRRRVRGIGWEFVHVAVDDATRLAYVEVLSDEQGVTCVQ